MKEMIGKASPFPLSQGILSNGFVFVSGQIPMKDGKLVEGSTEEQVHQAMANVKAVLDASGLTFDHVVKATIFITDMSSYGRVNEAYRTYFREPFPAREVVCVKELPATATLEISVIAEKS